MLYLNSLKGIVSKGDTKCCLMFSYIPGKMTHFLLLGEYATLAFCEHTKKLKHPHETNKQSTRRETYDNPDNPLCPVFSIERYNYINRFICWPSWLLMGNTTAQKRLSFAFCYRYTEEPEGISHCPTVSNKQDCNRNKLSIASEGPQFQNYLRQIFTQTQKRLQP